VAGLYSVTIPTPTTGGGREGGRELYLIVAVLSIVDLRRLVQSLSHGVRGQILGDSVDDEEINRTRARIRIVERVQRGGEGRAWSKTQSSPVGSSRNSKQSSVANSTHVTSHVTRQRDTFSDQS